MTTQNLWDAAKTFLSGKFIARLTKKELTFVTDLHVFLNYTPRILTGVCEKYDSIFEETWGVS